MQAGGTVIAATAVDWLSVSHGAWYVTFVVGMLIGMLPLMPGVRLPITVLASLAGWLLPLIVLGIHYNLRKAVATLSAVMGFGANRGWVLYSITLTLAILLGLAGLWLGKAIRNIVWGRHATVVKADEDQAMA
jgi:hypothetical protein